MPIFSSTTFVIDRPELELFTHSTDFDGSVEYRSRLDDDLGHMTCYFDPTTDIFDVRRLDTYKQHEGYGRVLLGHAVELAHTAQAELITSTITSRECLDSMVLVFGEKALKIEEPGDYLKQNTRAFLTYYL